MKSRLAEALVVAMAVLAVTGCSRLPESSVSGAGAAPPATEPPSADVLPSPMSERCGTIYESIDSLEPTFENLRLSAQNVVVATVSGQGEAFWSSPTGRAPTASDRPVPGNEFGILTPWSVKVEEAVSGTEKPGPLTVVTEGGRVGCFVHDVRPAVQLAVGEQYVLFLGDARPGDPSGAVPAFNAFLAFPVQADGKVVTPLDGAMSIAAFSKALAQPSDTSAP